MFYLLLLVPIAFIYYLAGRKMCKDCPHPERKLCFSVCEEFTKDDGDCD